MKAITTNYKRNSTMKILIVEDDFISRKVMLLCLSEFGECDIAVDGIEAIDAVRHALDDGASYDLICLDIMMPNMNGQEALRKIRLLEEERGVLVGRGVKVIMTTAMSDHKSIISAFREDCDSYLIKPIHKKDIMDKLSELGLT